MLEHDTAIGWKSTLIAELKALPEQDRRKAIRWLLREGRAAWKYQLNISRDKRALNCLDNSGILTIALARSFGEVVCWNFLKKNSKLLKLRGKDFGLNNITYLESNDIPPLPFPDNYFDTVTLNGVVEIIAETQTGNPRKNQLHFLKEIHRVLKPGGECLAGIENRCNYKYFAGKKEVHTGLLLISLLPRPLANWYSLIMQKKPYRTYTYSLQGYKKLFKQAGLNPIKIFSPYPALKNFSQILSLTPQDKINHRFFGGKSTFSKTTLLSNPRFAKTFAPSFSILTAKGNNGPSFLDKLLGKVAKDLEKRVDLSPENWRITSFVVASGNKVLLVMENYSVSNNKGPFPYKAIINIPMNPYADKRLKENDHVLYLIRKSQIFPQSLLNRIPMNLANGNLENERYYVEQMVPGVPGGNVTVSPKQKKEMLHSAFEVIKILHSSSLNLASIDDALFQEHFGKPLMSVADFFGNSKERKSMNILIAKLKEKCLGQKIPLVWQHGDFSLRNLLFNAQNLELTGVIDWDLSRRSSLPIIDLFQLIIREKRVQEHLSFKNALFRYLYPLKFEGFEKELLDEYMKEFSITESLLFPLSIMYWISRVGPHVSSLKNLDFAWKKRNFQDIFAGLEQMV